MYIGLHIYPYLLFMIFNLYGIQLQYENHHLKAKILHLLFVINLLQNFNHFEKLTENLNKFMLILHTNHYVENPMYKILLSPAGGLLCTVRLILKYNSVRDMAPNDRDVLEHTYSDCM